MFYVLKRQAFIAIEQVDDATILETSFEEYMLHDVIIAMRVYLQIGHLLEAPVETSLCHPTTQWLTGQAMHYPIGRGGIQPSSLIDMYIGGIYAYDEGEGSHNMPCGIQHQVAVALRYIMLHQLTSRLSTSPLVHIAIGTHDGTCLFK